MFNARSMVMGGIERCNSCVLPKSSYFSFDNKGVCSLCNAAKRINAVSQDTVIFTDELDAQIGRIKERGRGRSFDCVVGVSGGRDSSYLLYLLVHKHHLRCLAAYYRTPFTSEVTDANVRRLTAKLNVPLVEMGISREIHRRIAREFVILWTKKPSPVIANMACAPCKLVSREIYKIAKANGVKSIIWGTNIFEAVQIASGISRNEMLTNSTAAKRVSLGVQFQKTIMLIKRGISALGTSVKLWQYISIGFQASVMYISPHTPYLRFRYSGISVLEYFYFTEWDEVQCKKTLLEVGWELPFGCRSTWKSDCSFAELKNCMFRRMTGATYFDAFISNMVRNGVLSRDEALRRVEVEGAISSERISETCRILELPNSLLLLFEQKVP
jgi:hypothetical protein